MFDWYYPRSTLLKNRLFNFEIGARGNGKTTGAIRYIIDEWQKDNTFECVWLRRYKSERKNIINGFFNTVINNNFYPDLDFKTKGNVGLINDKTVIHFLALSVDGRIKGLTSPNVRLIVFDEFLVDSRSRYLPGEVNAFLGLYDTIARPNDPNRQRTPVLFLANAMTETNPYFLFFNIRFNEKKEFKTKGIYARLIPDNGFSEYASNTEFGKLLSNTEYGEHSINNQFLLDNYSFIESKSVKSQIFANLVYDDQYIGCWADWNTGKVYLSYKHNKQLHTSYSVTNNNLPNVLTVKFMKNTRPLQILKEAYNRGCLYYENLKIKNLWYKYLKILNL